MFLHSVFSIRSHQINTADSSCMPGKGTENECTYPCERKTPVRRTAAGSEPVVPLKMLTPARIREMVRRIVDAANSAQVVLFGAYARGTPHKDSDIAIFKNAQGKTGRSCFPGSTGFGSSGVCVQPRKSADNDYSLSYRLWAFCMGRKCVI